MSCSEASCRSSGCKSHQRRGPATDVVISSGGEGDRTAGSLDVKVPDGWETGRIRAGGRANWQAVAKCANRVSHEMVPPRETDCGKIGNAEPLISRRRPCRHRCLELTVSKSPGSVEDGMPGRNGQRKPGTARGSPRRSRTAKAARISRRAVKSRCAREWVGWGRLSDDGPGHYNPDPSEGPWGGGDST